MNLDSLRWCGHCKTRGDHHTDRHPCPTCEGSGYAALDTHYDCGDCYEQLHPCPDCGGTGKRRALLLGPEVAS